MERPLRGVPCVSKKLEHFAIIIILRDDLVKKEQKQEWDANTLCIPYYHSTTLPTVIHNACKEGWSDI